MITNNDVLQSSQLFYLDYPWGKNGEDHNLILYFRKDVFTHHDLKKFVNMIPHYSFGFDVDITIISSNKFLEQCRRYEDVEYL